MKKLLTKLFVMLLIAFTVQTVQAQAPVATAQEAITGLLNRIGGDGAANRFEIVIDASLAENGKDVFVITSQNGKPCIKGNTQLSVATGINWYLNHYAHINLTWNNLTTDLVNVTLPVPTQEEKHVCNTTYRYDFNTCTFSYSMAFWTWDRWQQEIDWMALHGINAPLNLVGLDVVTRKFLKELGVSESDIDAYIAGPGFIAWFAMNNLEGWGGTIESQGTGVFMQGNPDWWYTRQENLCRNMLQRMRELGMQPVIPGFSGQVPNCIVNYSINGFSSGDVVNNGTWAGGYTRPDILKPNTTSYQTFAAVYYKHLHEVMGVSELYSIDPFHEGSLPSGVSNETCYPNIMVELDKHFGNVEQSVKNTYKVTKSPSWIIQYWQGVPQSGAFTAMKDAGYTNRFIGLDLFADNIYADNAAKWRTNYYDTCPYIYCMLHNFGGRSGLHGRLETTMDGYFQALAKNNNCQGIGATPEGTETNPVLYDMLFELPWMDVNNRPTADEWLADYAHSRYGVDSKTAPAALEALKNLKKSVWDCKVNQQGTSEAVILARPNWTIGSVSSWSTSAIYWDTQDVLLAADQLYSVKDLVTANGGQDGIANYNYDFIDVVRQAMVDYAAQLLPLINAARNDDAEYTRLYQLYLQLMLDLDEMLSYDENFKLERWTSLARNIADEVTGTTENDRNWLEWNARTQVTVWSKGNTDLHDYSNRCWAGLIKDFHYKRWEKFFTTKGGSFDGGWFSGFEYPWTVDFNNTYNLAGDYSQVVIPTDMTATEKAAETFGNYFGRVKGAKKNYIFPMGVATNATKSDVIPEVYRGQEVELPLIIGKNVTISSVWVDLNNDGNAGNGETLTANGNNVTIPADAAIGKTTAKVTYSDGTAITFNLALVEDITTERTVTAVAGANGSVAIEGTNGLSISTTKAVKMTATANTGYNFENWTKGGEVVSNDNPFIYYGKEEATFTANFIQDKWGVPTEDKGDWGDATVKTSFVNELTFAYYNREPETIYEATTAPDNLFNTIPTIINVPQGASFDVTWSDDSNNGLKYCYFSAYIDLNADGDFTDEGELLKVAGTKGAQSTAACEGKINVILPYDAPLGITHMRLRFDGAWKDNGYDAKTKSYDAKAQLNRMCYEVVINITEKSDKAATINVETNSTEWGTVEVWTDETPDGSTGTEWVVSANIPMYLRATKTSEDVEFLGWYDQYGRLLTTELEHTMYAREDATYTARFRKYLEIDGWQIEYRTEGNNVILTKISKSGNHDLVIPETAEILGRQLTVIGFENNLFTNNKDLWSITLPSTMEFLSIKEVLSGTMTGKVENETGTENTANYTIYNLEEEIKVADGFTVTVTGTSNGNTFNKWGSGLFATGTNPLAATYDDGFQFYLAKAGNFVLKVDNGDKEYALDNSDCKVIANKEFTATIEYYNSTITITVDNGNGQTGIYTRDNVTLADISSFSAAIPKGISLKVNVDTPKEENPFSGCSNLDKIAINGTCKNYYINSNGDLYNSKDRLICSPEGKEKGADRRALAALIEEMKVLTETVATYSPTGKVTEVALNATQGNDYYIWCNNPHTGGNDGAGGVAALLDEDASTYLHSNWSSLSSTHDYLQIDFGNAVGIDVFKIAGQQRSSGQNDRPKNIEIYGSNDNSTWTHITTVEGLPNTAGATWESGIISADARYPHLKFIVKTHDNYNQTSSVSRPYFHMAKFDFFKVTSTADVLSYLEGGITNEQAAVAYDALVEAKYVFNNATTTDEMQAATTALQSAYDILETLLKAALPVELTLDENNPELYKIFIKRTADVTVLKYDEPSKMVAVENKANNSSWQTWYFMGGINGVTIHPYNANGKVLSADNTNNAPAKVWAANKGEKAFYEWKFVSRTDDYYNIQVHDGSNYFSNNGGTDQKMGFWSGSPESDGGSLFKFVEAEFENDNARYFQLKDLKESNTGYFLGTSIGLYTATEEYQEAKAKATELISAGSTSNSNACYEAYKALYINPQVKYNAPDPAKFYIIKSTANDEYCSGKYVHTYYEPHTHPNATWGDKSYDHRHLLYKEIDDIETFPLAVFQFETTGTEGEYKMKNLHTGLYVKSFEKNAEHMGEAADAAAIKIHGVTDGQVKLHIGYNNPMHAQNDYGVIVTWSAAPNNASTWTIDEVSNINDICYNAKISGVEHSTLYLNYPVAIPAGVKAYTANEIVNDKWLNMKEIFGTIPAKTAVVLKGSAGDYTFNIAKETRSNTECMLKGTPYKQTITKGNGNYYVLANIDTTPDDGVDNKELGFYTAINADNNNEFINAANKAYLHVYRTDGSAVSFFGFRFDDEDMTSIKDIEEPCSNEVGSLVIHDLSGRKLTEITEKGIYIINGKKTIIR